MKLTKFILESNRRIKELIVLIFDVVISIFSTWLSFFIRLDLEVFLFPTGNSFLPFIYSILIFMPIFFMFSIYSSMFRYFDMRNIKNLIKAFFFYTIIFATIIYFFPIPSVPRSIGIIQPIVFFLYIFLSRISFSNFFSLIENNEKKLKVLIYGAGKAGAQASNLFSNDNNCQIVGFVDDDIEKIGRKIYQYQIFDVKEMSQLKDKFRINQIIVAISNLKPSEKKLILSRLEYLNISIKILPNIKDLVDPNLSISDFKDISVLDLIEKRSSKNLTKLDNQFKNKKIIVTGAGGSIGSELCKQIIKLNPKEINLIDNSEFNLYSIEKELIEILNKNKFDTKINIKLLSITNNKRLNSIFQTIKPNYVFHAAAYKHVPIVEANIIESIENNIIGTVNTVNASIGSECERFVLISTDKAVRPTNIMGATKRFAEMYVQAINHDLNKNKVLDKTKLSMVRFGNVIDSSGSVVPLFRKQINDGGPITVTHPNVTRYFMTIPEAANLILDTSILSKGGEVFILDMGDPMKISDLADKMLKLSGYRKTEDYYSNSFNKINIEYTGLRPGEKLYEELIIDQKNIKRINEGILVANENFIDLPTLKNIIEEIKENIEIENIPKLISILTQNIEDFTYQNK